MDLQDKRLVEDLIGRSQLRFTGGVGNRKEAGLVNSQAQKAKTALADRRECSQPLGGLDLMGPVTRKRDRAEGGRACRRQEPAEGGNMNPPMKAAADRPEPPQGRPRRNQPRSKRGRSATSRGIDRRSRVRESHVHVD